jgi:hypothetical protein
MEEETRRMNQLNELNLKTMKYQNNYEKNLNSITTRNINHSNNVVETCRNALNLRREKKDTYLNQIYTKENKCEKQKELTYQNLKTELTSRSKIENQKLKSAREQLDNIKLEVRNNANSIIKRQKAKNNDLQNRHNQLKTELQQKAEINKLRKEDQLDN